MKLFHFLYVAALFSATSQAQEIDIDTARNLAFKFFSTKNKTGSNKLTRNEVSATVNPVLTYTAKTDSTPDFYVFTRDAEQKGFVIINAHADSDTPILGYADTNSFDYDNLPDNLRWWLGLYQTNGVAKAPAHASAARHDVEPLVSSKWGQNEPYNNAIPCQAGYKPFPTGCVATAMAQIMKFWNYPTRGQGYNSYSRTYNGGEFTLDFEADFGNTTYDWDSMLDSYDNNSTTAQKNAAALLAYHAGVSVNMKYAGSSSSSDSRDAAGALANNFCYDHSIMVGQRDYFSDADWAQTIYNELADGRPLLYAGTTPSGAGHAFVCHGYDAENELYAINWGWNGNYDGYFALAGPDALKPHGTGTGGGSADEGYTDNQRIIYNIFPDEGGEPIMQIGTYQGFTIALNYSGTNTFEHLDIDRSTPNADVRVCYNYSPFNYGVPTVSGNYGVMMRNVVNGAVYHNTPQFSYTLDSRHYVAVSAFYDFDTSLLPCNGTYEIIPAFTTNDDPNNWHAIATPGNQPIPTITITGGESPQPIALPISLDETTIPVGKTATIAMSPYYTGNVSFASSNPEVASVDDEGVITAQKLGEATITVSAAGDEAFLPTEANFNINVVEHVVRPFEIKVGKTELLVGETTNIITKGYSGNYSYVHSPSGVLLSEADGTIRAMSNGKTTLFVTALDADYDHPETVASFTFNVKSKIPTAKGLAFTAYPYAGKDNLLTSNDGFIKLPIANTSDATLEPARVYYTISSDGGYLKGYTGYVSLKPGQGGTASIDLTGFMSYFTPGKAYSAAFYSDENRQKPLNIAYWEFYKGKTTDITLNVTDGVCSTLSLPFDASIPDGLEAYEIYAYCNDTFHLSPASSLVSGHSYIVCGAPGIYYFTGEAGPCLSNPSCGFMTGIHYSYNTYVPAGAYLLSGNKSNALLRNADTTTAPLWTAYVNMPVVNNEMLSLSKFTNTSLVTGVDVPLTTTSSAIFSLDGHPIPSLRPGVNIIRTSDGSVRKIVVR